MNKPKDSSQGHCQVLVVSLDVAHLLDSDGSRVPETRVSGFGSALEKLGILVGVKVRNMKMDLNIYGTWCWFRQ